MRYVMWRLFGPMVLITSSLTLIAWLTQALRFIDMIVNRGLSLTMFLYISALTLPALLWVVLPISTFISSLIVFNRLALDSELVALKNAGLSRFEIIKPALVFGTLVGLVISVIALYLLPASYREFKDIQSYVRNNYASVLLQEGVFSSPSDSLTVYIKERGKNGALRGILVQDSRDEQRPVTFMAQEGKFIPSNNGSPRILLSHGTQQQVDNRSGNLQILYFDSYVLDIKAFGATLETMRWREPQERYLHELFMPDDTPQESQRLKLYAEGHHRLTWPFYAVFFALLGTAPFIIGQFNRRGYNRRIIVSIVVGGATLSIALALNSLAAQHVYVAPLVYLFAFGANGWLLCKLLENREFNPLRWFTPRFLKNAV